MEQTTMIDGANFKWSKPLSSTYIIHSLITRGRCTPSGNMLRCTASSNDTPNTGRASKKNIASFKYPWTEIGPVGLYCSRSLIGKCIMTNLKTHTLLSLWWFSFFVFLFIFNLLNLPFLLFLGLGFLLWLFLFLYKLLLLVLLSFRSSNFQANTIITCCFAPKWKKFPLTQEKDDHHLIKLLWDSFAYDTIIYLLAELLFD